MSPRLNRVWLLLPFLLLASRVWALGLGDIRLSSALNEPLRAEIELLAATPEELTNLTVQLASQETFRRYDLDRPIFLNSLQFQIIRSGRADGNIIRITSTAPITEPFVTFLVEASWSRGRLLREYTVLLDPPTFAPPPTTQATETVTAPTRTAPADAGEIQRAAPPQQEAPPARPPARPSVQPPVQTPVQESAQEPAPVPEPVQQAPAERLGRPDFDATSGGDVLVVRGDTLWGITQRVRPDSRLTINQTMLAIYAANPEAFNGNINRLKAGATLRIPSADDIFRIGRSEAFAEVQRQNNEWRGQPAVSTATITEPSLTLVPPDAEDEASLSDTSIDTTGGEVAEEPEEQVVIDPVEQRIQEIQAILEDQDALIEIPDNELAALRQELAQLRGESLPAEEPADDIMAEEEAPAGEEVPAEEEQAPEGTATEQAPEVTTAPPVVSRPTAETSIVDTLLGYLNNFWVWIGAALVATVGILVWFMRRAARRDDEDATGVWDALDADESDLGSMASTERLRALARDDDESFVVVETSAASLGAGLDDLDDTAAADDDFGETLEIPSTRHEERRPPAADRTGATGAHKALEDTFSSETAINLDQTDPVAEADFHMAYGLYDQAADLINGALEAEPDREDLLAKLCEIYFVWGNRDAFIDAAERLKQQVGGASNADWDKIVIMGQQIAGDHKMFSGVSAEGATRAVDLSFDSDAEDTGALDIDFAAGDDDDGAEVIDLGGGSKDDIVLDETGQVLIRPDTGGGIDFSLDDDDLDIGHSATREMTSRDDSPTIESTADGETAEMPAADTARTGRTPTIEEQFDMDATGEMPAMDDDDDGFSIPSAEATAEIDLDDLGLDLDSLEESALGGDLADDDAEDTATGKQLAIDEDELAATGRNLALTDDDMLEATGRNRAIDEDDDLATTSRHEVIDIEDMLAETGDLPSFDDDDASTGLNRALGDDEATRLATLNEVDEDTDIGIDTSLLDATGQTQILTEDMAVETATSLDEDLDEGDATTLGPAYRGDGDDEEALSDDAATLLASLDDDDEDSEFDFAKTEALPKDIFSPDMSTDETGRMPGLTGSTDMDLDLDDLTAALKVSEVGDTVNQVRDEATVQQPRLRRGGKADTDSKSSTQSLSPEDMSDELLEARTMTEVGTKLDLARAYVDMGDPAGARSILEEVLDEGDAGQRQQAQQLLDSLPS